jgi:hypothetical protein
VKLAAATSAATFLVRAAFMDCRKLEWIARGGWNGKEYPNFFANGRVGPTR